MLGSSPDFGSASYHGCTPRGVSILRIPLVIISTRFTEKSTPKIQHPPSLEPSLYSPAHQSFVCSPPPPPHLPPSLHSLLLQISSPSKSLSPPSTLSQSSLLPPPPPHPPGLPPPTFLRQVLWPILPLVYPSDPQVEGTIGGFSSKAGQESGLALVVVSNDEQTEGGVRTRTAEGDRRRERGQEA